MSNAQYVIVEKQAPVAKVIEVAGEDVTVQIVNPQNKVLVEVPGLFQQNTVSSGGGARPNELEFVSTVAGAQAVTIGVPFYPDSTSLFKNGVKQPKNSYSFGAGQLQLPAELEIYPDDLITFHYYPI